MAAKKPNKKNSGNAKKEPRSASSGQAAKKTTKKATKPKEQDVAQDTQPDAAGAVLLQPIREEMEQSFLEYAMSVIVDRALPDVRDGLKPVHRRILFSMREMGLTNHAKFRKSATVVGEVMGKYHPHGDQAIYDTMVRLAQDFAMRYPLVLGQGNFGDIDGDAAAAMRYTEAKMTAPSEAMLADIDKETVDFRENYDGTRKEPTVLPAGIPNLLLNGASGIAVGMATNIPPHNMGEIIEALELLAKKPKTQIEDLLKIVKGPDFPTGGIIYGKKDIAQAYAQGTGGVVMRGVAEIVDADRRGDAYDIVVTEIPYEIKKAALIEQIANLVRDKKIEGIRDIRDESDRDGMRIVVELKSDVVPQRILNVLYKRTNLQRTYHFNMIALVDGIQPKVLSLKEILEEYLKHRREVITRRTQYELEKAKERAHILEGLDKALSKIDAVIKVIKAAASKEDAHTKLMKKFDLSDVQASAILALPLSSLARLEREKIKAELGELKKRMQELRAILKDSKKLTGVLIDELTEIRDRFADERRTKVMRNRVSEISDEDLIPDKPAAIVLTSEGYVKRVPPETFRAQKRGGKGVTGVGLKDDEHVDHFTIASTHDTILFFTSRGRVFKSPAYEIPQASRTSRGRALVNFIALSKGESIAALVAVPKEESGSGNVVLVTQGGIAKRMEATKLLNIRRNGLNAINIKSGDALKWVGRTRGEDDILLVTNLGMSLRFAEKDLRPMGRAAAGVKGVNLKDGDSVAGVGIVYSDSAKDSKVVVVTEKGYGKRVKVSQYRKQKRGGRGIKTLTVSGTTGEIVDAAIIGEEDEEIIAVSAKGKTIRTALKEVRTLGRTARGARMMKLDAGDRLASFSVL